MIIAILSDHHPRQQQQDTKYKIYNNLKEEYKDQPQVEKKNMSYDEMTCHSTAYKIVEFL